jgi:ADP-ribosylation factor-binding protein GGA
MEEEEKAAQSAKLQELIRRGGPEDLQEANRLMKIMAGYDTRHKTDYRAKAAEEVSRVQQKARLLEERLAEFKPGDKMTEGDVYEELASALQSAHPKIQKMCEEESDDHEAVAKLLEINDSIHRTVERYKLMKQGDVDAALRIAKGTLGTSTGVGKNAANELSLIDFGGEEANGGSSTAVVVDSQPGGLEDDLLGLSMVDGNYGQGGGISLGFGNNTSKLFPHRSELALTYVDIPSPALISSTTENSTAKNPTPSRSPAPSQAPVKPDYSAFSAFGSSSPIPSTTPQPSLFQQQQFQQQAQLQAQQQAFTQQSSSAKSPTSIDPFAHLSTPQPTIQSTSSSSSLFDFSNPQPTPQSQPAAHTDDDEWAFSSALPDALPSSNNVTVSNTSLNISLHATREPASPAVITLSVAFSNLTDRRISELTFMAAVTKVLLYQPPGLVSIHG